MPRLFTTRTSNAAATRNPAIHGRRFLVSPGVVDIGVSDSEICCEDLDGFEVMTDSSPLSSAVAWESLPPFLAMAISTSAAISRRLWIVLMTSQVMFLSGRYLEKRSVKGGLK